MTFMMKGQGFAIISASVRSQGPGQRILSMEVDGKEVRSFTTSIEHGADSLGVPHHLLYAGNFTKGEHTIKLIGTKGTWGFPSINKVGKTGKKLSVVTRGSIDVLKFEGELFHAKKE